MPFHIMKHGYPKRQTNLQISVSTCHVIFQHRKDMKNAGGLDEDYFLMFLLAFSSSVSWLLKVETLSRSSDKICIFLDRMASSPDTYSGAKKKKKKSKSCYQMHFKIQINLFIGNQLPYQHLV